MTEHSRMNDRADSMIREPERKTLSILFVAIFLGLLGLGIVIPLLPIFVDEYGASGFWVGALFAGYGLSRILFTPLSGTIPTGMGENGSSPEALLSLLLSPFSISCPDPFTDSFLSGLSTG